MGSHYDHCQVMTFYIQHFMFGINKSESGADQSIFPKDMQFIPEFSVVDMHLMTSHNDTEGGYGCKLKRLEMHHTSLYSYLGPDNLQLLPKTYDRAVELTVERAKNNQFIHNQFEAKDVAFFGKVPDNSFVSSVQVAEGYYRIVGPNGAELFPGVPCVDIAQEDLFRFSNAVGAELSDKAFDAITLLDFASSASSLWMYVVGVSAYKNSDPMLSDFRGVPLVDVDTFLESVDFEDGETGGVVMEDKVVFPFKHDIVSLKAKAVVTVFTSTVVSAGTPAPCPDFALVSEACAVAKGYVVTIGTRAMPDMFRFVFNVMGCSVMPGGTPVRMDYATAALERSNKRRKTLGDGAGFDGAGDGGEGGVVEAESP
jgi:hypothetical protein